MVSLFQVSSPHKKVFRISTQTYSRKNQPRLLPSQSTMKESLYIASSQIAFQLLAPLFDPLQEEIWILGLSRTLYPIQSRCCFRGTIDSCMVHPRELFAPLIEMRASHFILAHNHPHGNPEPSPQDLEMTKVIEKAGRLLMLPLLDHIIIANAGFVSLHQRGLVKAKYKTASLF